MVDKSGDLIKLKYFCQYRSEIISGSKDKQLDLFVMSCFHKVNQLLQLQLKKGQFVCDCFASEEQNRVEYIAAFEKIAQVRRPDGVCAAVFTAAFTSSSPDCLLII